MGRDYSISQVNGNNNQTYCIGTDNGATNGNPRLVLKSCTNINDCSTYWEIENISDYSPSLVNAQGCGSFSNGSNNNNPTPSTPPSYTPPSPTPNPTPTPNPGTGGGTPTTFAFTSYYSDSTLSESQVDESDIETIIPEDDTNVVSAAQSIADTYWNQINSEIVSGVSQCNIIDVVCINTNTYFKSSAGNAIEAIKQFLYGIKDQVGSNINILDIVSGLWNALWNIGSILQSLWNLITNPILIVKGLTGKLNEFANSTFYQKFYTMGKIVGEVIFTVALALLTAGIGVLASKLSTAKNTIGALSKINIASKYVGKTFKGTLITLKNDKAVSKVKDAFGKIENYTNDYLQRFASKRALNFIKTVKKGDTISTLNGNKLIPLDYIEDVAKNGKGKVFNSSDGTLQIRVMYPDNLNPNGYMKIQNNYQTYFDVDGKVLNGRDAQHIQLTKK